MQKERAQTFKESPNTATTRTLSDTAKHACQASESDRAFVAACGAGQALTRAERAGRAAYVPPWARQAMAGRIDDAAVPHSCCPGEGCACWTQVEGHAVDRLGGHGCGEPVGCGAAGAEQASCAGPHGRGMASQWPHKALGAMRGVSIVAVRYLH